MFQQNTLGKLYPHLNFGRVPNPSVKAQETPNPIRSTSVHSNRSVNSERNHSERETTPTREDSPPVVKNVEPVKKVEKVKKVKVVEPTPEPPKPIEQSKPIVKRPNRVKPEPKPEPKRASQVPVKGEQGLQRKYSTEQRKQIYLDRLSRKSVKNAEKEITKVNDVLESVGHDVDKLKEVEREVKGKLKLINYAKYFTGQSNINETQKSEPSGDMSKKSQGSKMPTVSNRDTESTSKRRGRGSRNGTESGVSTSATVTATNTERTIESNAGSGDDRWSSGSDSGSEDIESSASD
jgi:hypothetical protein